MLEVPKAWVDVFASAFMAAGSCNKVAGNGLGNVWYGNAAIPIVMSTVRPDRDEH